jgi:hypothetical protein
MKRILIVSKVFYPNISPRSNRTTQLALEFARQGHNVTVMLPDLDADYYKEYFKNTNIIFKSLGRSKYKSIKGDSFFARALSRLFLLLIEYPDIQLVNKIKKVLKYESGYDLLISIAVPHPNHWGVASAIRRNKSLCKVWAADCGDPYMGCKTDTFEKLFHFKYVEKSWCKLANFIVVPETSSKSGYYHDFQHKIRVIPQGFNLTEIMIPDYQKNEIPTFAYAGALALHFRNPIPLLNFLCTLDIEFKFIIYTESEIPISYVEKLKGKLELKNYVQRKELLLTLSQMDFLINFENNTSVQVPSKLIDYSIINRPVLSISKVLDTTVFAQFLKGDYSNKFILPDIKKYDIKQVANQFLNLIKEHNEF